MGKKRRNWMFKCRNKKPNHGRKPARGKDKQTWK